DYLVALQMKGEVLRRMVRLKDLIVTMRHALEIAPDDIYSLNLMVYALRTSGEYDLLQQVVEHLIGLAPDTLYALESQMIALRGLGKFEEAREPIDRILELDSDNVHIWT